MWNWQFPIDEIGKWQLENANYDKGNCQLNVNYIHCLQSTWEFYLFIVVFCIIYTTWSLFQLYNKMFPMYCWGTSIPHLRTIKLITIKRPKQHCDQLFKYCCSRPATSNGITNIIRPDSNFPWAFPQCCNKSPLLESQVKSSQVKSTQVASRVK